MTKLTHPQSENEFNYSKNKQLLEYLKQEIKYQSPSDAHNSLLFAYEELHDLVGRLLNDNQALWNTIDQKELDLQSEHVDIKNFESDKEKITKILLKEIEIGQIFYPSDIADKYGLDLKTVVDVISELKEKKQFIENPE